MKVKHKASGAELEVDAEQGHALVARGAYEEVTAPKQSRSKKTTSRESS